ncbi:MAG: hypothetical protein ACRD2D_00530 [Terriglobales bacterium]
METPLKDDPPLEPIPMPVRHAGIEDLGEQLHDTMHTGVRRLRAETKRLGELLRSAQTHAGRSRNLAPLLVLVAGGTFVLGLTLGLLRRRR